MTRTARRGADILLAFPALLVAVMFGPSSVPVHVLPNIAGMATWS
ncbi:hypothetical protein [Arthrobacter sp. A5]